MKLGNNKSSVLNTMKHPNGKLKCLWKIQMGIPVTGLGLQKEGGKAGTEARRILRRSQNIFVFNKKMNHSGKGPERNSIPPQTVWHSEKNGVGIVIAVLYL